MFNYIPVGHVITGDLFIVVNGKLRNTLRKGPKYREPQHINWSQSFKLLMDSVEHYARKRGETELQSYRNNDFNLCKCSLS